ncbi:unnamed protein product, partial [Phaeothamnion confervicola]
MHLFRFTKRYHHHRRGCRRRRRRTLALCRPVHCYRPPRTSDQIAPNDNQRQTPGAITSIAFGRVEPLVDGNVVRVLARLRAVRASAKDPALTRLCWQIAGELVAGGGDESGDENGDDSGGSEDGVDQHHPGDFNQALMELGAMICSPKSPSCGSCPVREHCHAFRLASAAAAASFEDGSATISATATSPPPSPPPLPSSPTVGGEVTATAAAAAGTPATKTAAAAATPCALCEPVALKVAAVAVTDFPSKAERARPRKQVVTVVVVEAPDAAGQRRLLLMRRPSAGLLAGQWEAPSAVVDDGSGSVTADAHRAAPVIDEVGGAESPLETVTFSPYFGKSVPASRDNGGAGISNGGSGGGKGRGGSGGGKGRGGSGGQRAKGGKVSAGSTKAVSAAGGADAAEAEAGLASRGAEVLLEDLGLAAAAAAGTTTEAAGPAAAAAISTAATDAVATAAKAVGAPRASAVRVVSRRRLGTVLHVFSHLRHTMHVEWVRLEGIPPPASTAWSETGRAAQRAAPKE